MKRFVSFVTSGLTAVFALARCSPQYEATTGVDTDAGVENDATSFTDAGPAVDADACATCVAGFLPVAEQSFITQFVTGTVSAFSSDFDGDGFGDIVLCQRTDTANVWYLLYGSANGQLTLGAKQTHPLGVPAFRTWKDTAFGIGDFDGDGKTDLVFIATGAATGLSFHASMGTAARTFTHRVVQNVAGSEVWSAHRFAVGDATGDGIPDVVAIVNASSATAPAVANVFPSRPVQQDFGTRLSASRAANTSWGNYEASLIDSNGDGKLDVGLWNPTAATLFLFVADPLNPSGFFVADPNNSDSHTYPQLAGFRLALSADVDGDGARDTFFTGPTNFAFILSPRDGGVDAAVPGPTLFARPPAEFDAGGTLDLAVANVRGTTASELLLNSRLPMMNRTRIGSWNGSTYVFDVEPVFDHPDPRNWSTYTFRSFDVDGDRKNDLVWLEIGATTRVEVVLSR